MTIPSTALRGRGHRPRYTRVEEGGAWLGLEYLGLLRRGWEEHRARRAPQAVRSYWREYEQPRLIDGNGIAMHLTPAPPEIERVYQLLFRLLKAYDGVCRAHDARFAVMIHSQRYQIQPRDLAATMETYALRPSHFDLMQPNRRIAEFCRREGIPCFDPTRAMAATHARFGAQLFMPRGDMHWNARGARAFFDGFKHEFAQEIDATGDR